MPHHGSSSMKPVFPLKMEAQALKTHSFHAMASFMRNSLLISKEPMPPFLDCLEEQTTSKDSTWIFRTTVNLYEGWIQVLY